MRLRGARSNQTPSVSSSRIAPHEVSLFNHTMLLCDTTSGYARLLKKSNNPTRQSLSQALCKTPPEGQQNSGQHTANSALKRAAVHLACSQTPSPQISKHKKSHAWPFVHLPMKSIYSSKPICLASPTLREECRICPLRFSKSSHTKVASHGLTL